MSKESQSKVVPSRLFWKNFQADVEHKINPTRRLLLIRYILKFYPSGTKVQSEIVLSKATLKSILDSAFYFSRAIFWKILHKIGTETQCEKQLKEIYTDIGTFWKFHEKGIPSWTLFVNFSRKLHLYGRLLKFLKDGQGEALQELCTERYPLTEGALRLHRG